MVEFELQLSFHALGIYIIVFLHVMYFSICTYAGTEWQYWLLFYSLPLLSGILPNVYYLHYCALVCAIAMLVSGDLDMASVLLKEFHRHAGDLYGKICIDSSEFYCGLKYYSLHICGLVTPYL